MNVSVLRALIVGTVAFSLGGTSARGEPMPGLIDVVSSTGGKSHALTTAPAMQPALSPGGHTIAYVSDQIRLMNTDGSEQRPLGAASGERPQWSPDGGSLVYTGQNSDLCYPGPAQRCVVGDLWKVNTDGSGQRRLFQAAEHPVWSPSGRLLVFRDFVVGEVGEVVGALKTARPDGSHVRTLYRGLAIDGVQSLPTWSPDGRWIAFNIWRGQKHRLYLIRADGSHVRRLTDGTYPVWSPDGKLIAFERGAGVWVIAPNGKHARRISADGSCPTWSPQGGRIAFLTNTVLNPNGRAALSRLVVTRSDGHGRRVLAKAADCYANGWAEPSPPVWSRDGRRIYFVSGT